MAGIILITIAVVLIKTLGSVDAATNIVTQNFGQGYVVFSEYYKVQQATVDFYNGPTIPLHIVYRDNQVLMDSRLQNDQWVGQVKPSAYYLGQAINKITTVVEVKSHGFDVFMNGQHQYYQNPTNSPIKAVTIKNTTPLQFSVGKVLRDFSMGRVIYIKATAPTSGDFKIDLLPTLPREMTYKWRKSSLVLHARFSSNPQGVTRNTYGPICYGVELGETSGGMPFTAGEKFEMTIVAQQFGFEIGVNGDHFASYDYRTPLSRHMTVMLTNVPIIEKIEYY